MVMLNSFESMKEETFEPSLFKLLMRIGREGLSVGVHLLITAGRKSNLRAILYANFKHQLTLKQNDIQDIKEVTGNDPLVSLMEDIKGRALMKREELNSVQLALPVSGENDIQVINNLRNRVNELNQDWMGIRPKEVPMVPDELTEYDFYNRPAVQATYGEGVLPLGLDIETVEPVIWDISKGNLLYLTDKEEQMLILTQQIARSKQKIIILAPQYHNLPEMKGVTILDKPEEYQVGIATMEAKIKERLEKRKSQHEATVILYNQLELVEDMSLDDLSSLLFVLEKGPRAGYSTVAISSSQLIKQIDSVSKVIKTYRQAILSMRINDQAVVTVNSRPLKEEPLAEQVHYYIADGRASKIKVLMM